MALLAVTVLGHDRPGIIAEVTGQLARLGGNLEDTTMTLLRGHFAMVLIVRVDAAAPAVEIALAPVAAEGALEVSVREMPEPVNGDHGGTPWVVSVHGADRSGIVSLIMGVLAQAGGNVTDLSTRLTDELYVLVAEVVLPAGTDIALLQERLRVGAIELGVDVSLRPADDDLL